MTLNRNLQENVQKNGKNLFVGSIKRELFEHFFCDKGEREVEHRYIDENLFIDINFVIDDKKFLNGEYGIFSKIVTRNVPYQNKWITKVKKIFFKKLVFKLDFCNDLCRVDFIVEEKNIQ